MNRLIAVVLFVHVLPGQQQLTPNPAGPYHVAANRLIDCHGSSFLMRGTQLREFHLRTAAKDASSGTGFGPHSPTSLTAIRLRFNMNTARLPLDVAESGDPTYFSELAKVVRRINATDLLAVLSAGTATAGFWTRCAAYFKNEPNLVFAVSDPALVTVIRSAGARQPIAVRWDGGKLLDDPNVIYEVGARDPQIGSLADRVPVLATDWDVNLDDAAACSALPSDPSALTKLVQANLAYFDAHQISWTVSLFEPGKLIKDTFDLHATSLENGWTCGHRDYAAGLGRLVQAHLRAGQERGLFVVSASGSLDVARGGFAIAYGPVMAQRDEQGKGNPLPLKLGGIAVKVTDALGVARPAGLYWASAGWGQVNFVIPDESAPGPARMTIERDDTSRESAPITIADTAPGFWTGISCRGPAHGAAIQTFAEGRTVTSPTARCDVGKCSTLPIPVTDGAVTHVQLWASGFRNARAASEIEVTVDGIRVRVVSYGASTIPGLDQLTIEIPRALAGRGEVDVLCHVNGRVSNAVQIRVQ